jgi:hypothetical protein
MPESFDLLLIDDIGSARKALTDLEIIEIEPVIVSEYLHGRCLRSQQALKCPSSFHYSENLLIEIQADLLQRRPLKPSEKGKWPTSLRAVADV